MPPSRSSDDDSPSEVARLLAGTAAFTSGFALFFCLPLFVGSAADTLGLDARQQGFLAAMDQGGMCVAGLASLWWISRWSWRRVGWIAQLGLGLANLACLPVDDLGILYSLRVLTGLCAGTVYAAGLAAIGTLRDTQRGFAISITLQLSFASAAFYLLSGWVEVWGFDAVVGYLGATALLLLAPMRWTPHGPRLQAEAEPGSAGPGSVESVRQAASPDWRGLAGLAGLGVTSLGVAAFWTFVERMGIEAGLSAQAVGTALAMSLLASIAGPLIASWTGSRLGLIGPILAGFACTALAMGLLETRILPSFELQYTAVAIGFQIGWNFSVPFIFALIARADPSARLIAVSVAVQTGGLALGPATGGLCLQFGGYAAVTWVGIAALGLAFLLLLPAALKQQRTPHL